MKLKKEFQPCPGAPDEADDGLAALAPGGARPVIRGFDGERVKLLIDSIGSIDAADISVDHGVTIDPLIVDHIDVVQGPAVLLFGGEAIGGAVRSNPSASSRACSARISPILASRLAGPGRPSPRMPRLSIRAPRTPDRREVRG